MNSSELEKQHTGSVFTHCLQNIRCVGVRGTRVRTGRSGQEVSEGEGSEGAVECSELGSVACQTLPERAG